MYKYILLFLLPVVCLSSEDYKIRNLYFDAEKAVLTNRAYEMPPGYERTHQISMGLDIDFLKYAYLNQRVLGMTGPSQFRHVSLEFETGLRPHRNFELYFRHYSGHAMDAQYDQRFPETNSIGFRLYLVRE